MSIEVIKMIFQGSRSTGSDRLMLLALGEHANNAGVCWPSINRLADFCNTTPRNATRLINTLRDLGEVKVDLCAGPSGKNVYRIQVDSLQAAVALKSSGPPTDLSPPDNLVTPDESVTPRQNCHPDRQSATPDSQRRYALTELSPEPSRNLQKPPDTSLRSAKQPPCPHSAIVDLYHEALPELPRVKLMGETRKKALGAFWKWVFTERRSDGTPRAQTAEEALAWIKAYFERARSNDFLMGRTARGDGHGGWKCDLDFLLTDKGKRQVIEKTAEVTA